MKGTTLFLFVVFVTAALVVGAGTWSKCTCGPIFEERGTLSVGIQGQYGYLVGDAPAADDFDNGPGYALRLRYYLGNGRALGISMESQKFDAVPQVPTGDEPREMTVALMSLDYLFYFQRASAMTRYITAGIGVHHPSRDFQNGSEVGPDGLVLTVGGGLEYFFHRVASVDVCVRGYGLFGQGGLLGSGEAAIGFNFYIVD